MNLHDLFSVIGRRFRRQRMRLFAEVAADCRRVVDLGGTPHNWRFADGYDVVLVNCDGDHSNQGFRFLLADATRCPLADNSFDIVFSNSLVEHVGSWEDQRRLAAEVRRLAPRYFVQTPNRMFPIEPHVLAPLVQFLPLRLRLWACAWLTPVGWLAPSRAAVVEDMRRVRLLTESEMRVLFPDAKIIREKFLGLTKSIIAVRGAPPHAGEGNDRTAESALPRATTAVRQ